MTKLEDSHFLISKYITKQQSSRMWYWHKGGHIDQLDRFESPKINPYIKGQLIFNKGAKIVNKERIVFLTNGTVTTGYSQAKG